jgi:hypothetical protein
MLLTAVLVAAKFNEEETYNNSYVAKVGGVLFHDMIAMELEFLFLINFELYVDEGLYAKYKIYLDFYK